ncbi:protein-tyrosine phosphatase-like protein [Haematococcus lacustris]
MPRVGPARDAWAVQDNSLKAPWTFRAKEKIQCLCEGGRWCTREDPARQRGGNAIPGLHCSWVGDKQNVLAMARPSQDKIVKMAMVDAFLKHNIGMILNLQEVGEHDSCGPGNLKHSGFSYDPESFMTARIGVYNFSWKDMGVPDLNKIMDIVQVMDYVTGSEGRKIAVHCHAGLGRTGLAIACHFLYSLGYSARKAIETVRRDRQGSIQTREQQLFVYVFEQYLAHLR